MSEADAADSAVPAPPSAVRRATDLLVRVAGGILSVVLAVLTGLLELVFAPLRVGGVLIGVSALAAVAVNVGLAWFAVHTVGRRWAIVLPWGSWTVLMFVAAGVRTDEGDYLLSGDNWVGMLLILLGSIAFAMVTYRRIMAGVPKR